MWLVYFEVWRAKLIDRAPIAFRKWQHLFRVKRISHQKKVRVACKMKICVYFCASEIERRRENNVTVVKRSGSSVG